MAVGQFCRNTVGPPEWGCEAMGSVVWVQCATSAECVLNLSIAAPADMVPVHSWSHCGSTVINNVLNNNLGSMMRKKLIVIVR